MVRRHDQSVHSKGTMYFILHQHGQLMQGRWVGLSYDGKIVTGWGAMAKTEEEARTILGGMLNKAKEEHR